MKKILFSIFCIMITLSLSGCNKNVSNDINEQDDDSSNEVGFSEKFAYKDKNDGWYYFFILSLDNNQNITEYFFNGYNLKYDQLDGYYIYLRDSKTNKILDKMPAHPMLSTSEEVRDEVDMINAFFNEKKFVKEIKNDDLKTLNTKYIDKSDLVELFNNALNAKVPSIFGNYPLSEYSIKSSNSIDGYKWQVGQFNNYGYLKVIVIELIYDNGEYLSDIVEKGNATDEQKKLYEFTQEVEKYIIDNQQLSVASSFPSYNENIYKTLYSTIASLDETK